MDVLDPHRFIQKWRSSTLKERSAAQSHFNDLCVLLGEQTPVEADPAGSWYTFEKGAKKTGTLDDWSEGAAVEFDAWGRPIEGRQ